MSTYSATKFTSSGSTY